MEQEEDEGVERHREGNVAANGGPRRLPGRTRSTWPGRAQRAGDRSGALNALAGEVCTQGEVAASS